MKKVVAMLLVVVLAFAFVACNSTEDASKSDSASSAAPAAESKAEEKSEEASKEESKAAEESSKAEEPSKEESKAEESKAEESSEPAPELPAYNDAFVYVAGQVYGMAATDSASIRLTKINDIPEAGDVVVFTPEFGTTIEVTGETYADYAILVVEYNKDLYKYYKKEIIDLDSDVDKSKIAIPSDGFVVAIHKDQTKPLAALKLVKDDVEIYPYGFQPITFAYDVKKTDTPFEIDGVFEDEWKDFLIDDIDENNANWDFSQFEKNDVSITAQYYMAYSDTGVYFAVVVNTTSCCFMPGISATNGDSMYSYTCIQVNACDQSPLSEYMLKNANQNGKAVSEDHMRQYGFSGSADGNSYYTIWWDGSHTELSADAKYAVVYDQALETVTYEVYLPYEEINIDPAEIGPGYEFSISISINSSSEQDVKDGKWKNIKARNGGGIIAMNEFTKMPVCTMQ